MASRNATPTIKTYREWQVAYDHFNEELFGGKLPDCLITLENKSKHILGYFESGRYKSIIGEINDGLIMNPIHFRNRSIEATMSTLVHEMCHSWQHNFGKKKSLHSYHNKEWSAQMKQIGLIPSDTGEPGGAETGQKMTHYIAEDGLFKESCNRLLTKEFVISWGWNKDIEDEGDTPSGKSGKRYKYFCSCNEYTLGKPDLDLMCKKCGTDLVLVHADDNAA
jgi:predicted SprT family Zn-dependent metalloprotease